MDGRMKKKVVAKVDFNNIVNHPPSRPGSPFKSQASQLSAASEASLRPKARVNTVPLARKASGSGSSIVSASPRAQPASSIPRPNSPFKSSQPQNRDGESQPTRSSVDAPPTKVKAAMTAHVLSRQRSLTASPTHLSFMTQARNRRGSGSLHPNDLPPSPALSLSPDMARASSPSQGSAVRVRAKVTGLAKSNAPLSPLSDVNPSTSPPYATTRPIPHRPTAPSISNLTFTSATSTASAPSSPQLSKPALSKPTQYPIIMAHPITTAVPAANPYRYAPMRPSPPREARGRMQSPPANHTPRPTVVIPKVDPATIPLPPHSPPTSTLSYSSRSSLSSASQNTQSSGFSRSTAPTLNSHVNGLGIVEREPDRDLSSNNVLDSLVGLLGAETTPDSSASQRSFEDREPQPDDPHRQIRAQAKSNRKIEDLEITNRSLLAINSSLEATKHRQAKEIRELRRKLRESRLILPPRAYRAVKSSLGPAELADDEDLDDEDDEAEDDTEEDYAKQDETYRRVKGLLDTLLESGRAALAATPDDFRDARGGAKVLSPEELRAWGDVDDASEARSVVGRDDSASEYADRSLRSEDEVEEMMSVRDVDPALLPPPIMVTLS